MGNIRGVDQIYPKKRTLGLVNIFLSRWTFSSINFELVTLGLRRMSHFPVGTTIELVINSFFTNNLIQIETFELLNFLLKIISIISLSAKNVARKFRAQDLYLDSSRMCLIFLKIKLRFCI